jgi:hypothetical protein
VYAIHGKTAYLLWIGKGNESHIYETTDAGKNWLLEYTEQNPRAFLDCMAFWMTNIRLPAAPLVPHGLTSGEVPACERPRPLLDGIVSWGLPYQVDVRGCLLPMLRVARIPCFPPAEVTTVSISSPPSTTTKSAVTGGRPSVKMS